jgi:hypothetical protein
MSEENSIVWPLSKRTTFCPTRSPPYPVPVCFEKDLQQACHAKGGVESQNITCHQPYGL